MTRALPGSTWQRAAAGAPSCLRNRCAVGLQAGQPYLAAVLAQSQPECSARVLLCISPAACGASRADRVPHALIGSWCELGVALPRRRMRQPPRPRTFRVSRSSCSWRRPTSWRSTSTPSPCEGRRAHAGNGSCEPLKFRHRISNQGPVVAVPAGQSDKRRSASVQWPDSARLNTYYGGRM